MGSGPVTWLAANYNPGALVIMSGYTSIRNVAGDVVGVLRYLVAEQFDNIK